MKYLKKDKSKKNIAVVTHNVILSLIGSEFKILPNKWHKINVNHLDKIEFIYFKGKILPNLSRRRFCEGFFNVYRIFCRARLPTKKNSYQL